MATKKITELTELTTVADDDYLPIVDTSGATTKKISRQNFVTGILPSGSIISYGGSVAPSGWILCDGAAVSRTTYATLYSAIGTAWGAGDGSTTFNVPNFKGRFPVGYNASNTDFNALGKIGGLYTVSLAHSHTAASAGSHTHSTDSQGNHAHSSSMAIQTYSYSDTVYQVASGPPAHYHDIYAAGSHSHTANSSGSHTHSTDSQLTTYTTTPPYSTVNFIIKT